MRLTRAIPAPPAAPLASILGLALVLALAAPACKSPVPADVPGEFTFRGVAVHPAAVRALYRSTTGLLDLAEFKTDLEALPWEEQPGWWITEFAQDFATGRTPFFAYAAFPGPITGGAETYILSITFNEGEPADIDNIVLLQKNGSWLGLSRAWIEGSACNGGIEAERMDNDNFLYSRDLTPPDLLALSIDPRLEIAPNEDLEAMSDSCYAAANYVYNLTQDREDLVSVRLYDEPVQDEKGRTERYRYQSCFNKVFNDYLAQGKKGLTPKEVDEFAARFRDACLKPASPVPAAAPVEK
jgi:hypothetical protein